MMKRLTVLLMLACFVVVALGCHLPTTRWVYSPIMKCNTTQEIGDTSVGHSKVGKAEAEGILLVYFGDNSITAEMEDGGITKIHHIDSDELNVLGLYSRKVTKVYGD